MTMKIFLKLGNLLLPLSFLLTRASVASALDGSIPNNLQHHLRSDRGRNADNEDDWKFEEELKWDPVAPVFDQAARILSSPLTDDTIRMLSEASTANVDLINSAIAASLDSINALIKGRITDPIDIDQSFATDIGTLSGGTCDMQIAEMDFNILDITGQNTTCITNITVQPGTESVGCGCPTNFGGTFDFVMSADSYDLSGSSDFLSMGAESCALTSTWVGAVVNPTFTGMVTLTGTINGNTVSIETASVDSIDVTCDSTSVTVMDLMSSDFGSLETEIGVDIGNDFKNYVETTLVSIVTAAIEAGMADTTFKWGFRTSASYIAAFWRANFGDNVQKLWADGGLF